MAFRRMVSRETTVLALCLSLLCTRSCLESTSIDPFQPLERESDSDVDSMIGSLRLWVSSGASSTGQTKALDGLYDADEVVHQSRLVFDSLVDHQGCSRANTPNWLGKLNLATFVVGEVTTKLIGLWKLEQATHALRLFLGLSACSDWRDDSPLVNFAIFPKLYKPELQRMTESEETKAMAALSAAFDGFVDPKESSVMAPENVMREADRASFQELAGYNLSFLQHRRHLLLDSRRTIQRIIDGAEVKTREDLEQKVEYERTHAQEANRTLVPLVVLTCASEARPHLNNLLSSGHDVVMNDGSNLTIEVLGLGDPFPGTFVKVHHVLRRVSQLPADQLVLVLDAYDTLIFPSIRDLPVLFQLGSLAREGFRDIVFSAERSTVAYPDPGVRSSAPDGSLFLWLNSGAFIGRAGPITEMALEVASYPSTWGSDQRGYTRYFITHRDKVGLDVDGKGFFSLHFISQSSYIDGASGHFRNDAQGMNGTTFPAVVHGNGGPRGGKEYYEQLSKVLAQKRERRGAQIGLGTWVEVKAPPFTLAALVDTGEVDLETVLEVFKLHVDENPSDVRATIYLASKLASMGVLEESRHYVEMALNADRSYTESVIGSLYTMTD